MKILKLLLVEDSPEDAELLLRTLRRGGYEPDVERVENADEMRAALPARPWDVIISDYTLPNFSAPNALDVLKEVGLDIPFIIVSGSIGEGVAVSLLKSGAQDFLLKGDMPRLIPALEREIQEAESRRARRIAEETLRETAERLKTFHAIDRAILTQQSVDVIAGIALDYFIAQHTVRAAVMIVFDFESQEALLHTAYQNPEIPRLSGQRVSLAAVPVDELNVLMEGGIHTADKMASLLEPAFTVWNTYQPAQVVSASSPMIIEGELLGALHVLSGVPAEFNRLTLDTLREIADQAAIGIHQRVMRDQLARYTQDLEQRVRERTQELIESEKRYRLLAENAQDIIYRVAVGASQGIEYVSPSIKTVLGYTPEECYADPMILLKWSYPEDIPIVEHILSGLDDYNIMRRLRWQHKDGRLVWIEHRNVAVRDESNEIIAIEGIGRDITEQKQIEMELQQALEKEIELNELKTRFVSMVSHDFRTPLAIIQSSAGILERYTERLNDIQRATHFDKIRSQIQRMVELLNDVLTITKADAGAMPFVPAMVDLDRLCRSVVDEFLNPLETRHRLSYHVLSQPNLAMVDERLLVQALVNLLTNAIKYSPEGSEVQLGLYVGSERIVLSVSDEGIGIPEADQQQMFVAFNRASNVGTIQGTGLGLAIVKRVVDAHNGTISLESQIGVGTAFVITLPVTHPQPDAETPPTEGG